MKIVGIFDDCGTINLKKHPSLKQVVIEEDGKYGIMYENPRNEEVFFDYKLENAKNDDEIALNVIEYVAKKIMANSKDTTSGSLENNPSKYAPVFFDKKDFKGNHAFMKVDQEHFRFDTESENAALALVAGNERIIIGSSKYLLEIMEVLYSNSQDKDVLKVKAELLENIGELEQAKETIQLLLETQDFDTPTKEMYKREIARLERKIKGRTLFMKADTIYSGMKKR